MANRSKSTLFLIEQLMVIVVFAICAVACISIMTAAYFNANDSRDLSMAVLVAQSGAEEFKATSSDEHTVIYYNKDWQICDEKSAVYALRISPNPPQQTDADGENRYITASLTVSRISGRELISFPLMARYPQIHT